MAVIGASLIADVADSGINNTWSLNSITGLIPVGTTSIRISLFGTKSSGQPTGGADGYIDNVSFRIIPEPSSAVLAGTISLSIASLPRRRNFHGSR